jgi:hypothetical protein
MVRERGDVWSPVVEATSGLRGGPAIAWPVRRDNPHTEGAERLLGTDQIKPACRRTVKVDNERAGRFAAVGVGERAPIRQCEHSVDHADLV